MADLAPFDFDTMLATRGIQANNPRARLSNWAHAYMIKGVQPAFSVMASPPTFSKSSGNASSVNGSYVNNVVQYSGQSGLMSWLGGTYSNITNIGMATKKGAVTTQSDASVLAQALTRVRFQTNAEAVDLNIVENSATEFNVIIDGQLARRSRPFGFANSGNVRWAKASFGANAITYSLNNTPATPVAGGTGHAVDDILTLNGGAGGAGGTPAQVRVAQVSGGAVTSFSIENPGAYTTQPTGNFSQASSTGSGTGFTCSASILAKSNSLRKMRTWELLLYGVAERFGGIVLPSGAAILPAPENLSIPKIMFIGDSITAHTYNNYAGCGIAETIAQMLGLWERHVVSARGGTGWNVDNGTSLRWSHASRIADVVREAPDILVYIGSQNDTSGSTLQTAITTALTTIQAALPETLIVGIGNIMGDSTTLANSIAAGFAGAPDQTRVRFLNNHSPFKWIPTATISDWQTLGDANHPHDDALTWFANLAATQIGDAVMSMALAR